MTNTFEAAVATLIALIPGAVYVWARERRVGRWGAGFGDILLRYFGVSAGFHLLLAPLSYWLWSEYVASGVVEAGASLPWATWGYASVYLFVPLLIGLSVGARPDRWPLRIFTSIKSPTGWDHLFGLDRQGWVKLKLKSGTWIGGWFGRAAGSSAFASSYPHPRELYLPQTIEVDDETGRFVVDERRRPYHIGPGILVRWDDVEYLKFAEVKA